MRAARAAAIAALTAGIGLFAVTGVGLAQQEPVELSVEAPAVAAAGTPFELGVEVDADPGALGIAARPLRLRVALEPQCGGSFAGTEGPVAIDREIPAPPANGAYRFSGQGTAKVDSFGPRTVCAFVEDAEERQFATSTETVIDVSRSCTAATGRLARLRRAARRAARHRGKGPTGRRAARKRRRAAWARVRRAKRAQLAACRAGQLAERASASARPRAAAALASATATPQIKHLFTIVLENQDAEKSFGSNPPSPYLGGTLPDAGAFIPNYFGIGHESLDNYIAMVSGQPPNLQTQADCQIFSEMLPGNLNGDGIAVGQGCVYPAAVKTVADQLQQSGHTWAGYMQDMANSVGSGQPATCRHPALGAPDDTQKARAGDQYAVRHNPFVYFHSIIDSPACKSSVVDLRTLPDDLDSEATTPEYAFITPDLCADGHDQTCADGRSPGGFAGIDAFLREWVPRIEASPAYQDQGMILVTFDESESGADSCCGEATGPNTINNGGPDPGSGGGRIGAVVLSPCIAPGTVSDADYNHYSYLRWVEQNFGLGHLANARPEAVGSFGADVFSRPDCSQGTRLEVTPRRVRAKRRTAFHLRLIAELPLCRQGVTIGFAGRQAITDADGEASLRVRLRGRRPRVATASPSICEPATATVRVKPRKRHRKRHLR